jgi:hypothetical protein
MLECLTNIELGRIWKDKEVFVALFKVFYNLLLVEELRRMTELNVSVVDVPVDIQMWHLLKYKSVFLHLYLTHSL